MNAFVSGASRGLGLAMTGELARRGWTVLVDARDEVDLRAAVAGLSSEVARGAIEIVPGDVSDPAHRRALVTRITQHGTLDALINNASWLGPSPQPTLAKYPLDALRRVYEVNVFAPLALIQELAPLLRKPGGVVINITSDAAVEGYEGWGGYGSSKAALEQMSRILALEQPELHVYWVDPGDMNTRMHQEAFPGEDISDRPPPEVSIPGIIALIEGSLPSGRYHARQVPGRVAKP